MRRALNRCCRNVRWKDSVIGYELHAAQNTHALIGSLRNGTYKISPYQRFIIYEPKRREIVATRIADRQVQMALCENGLYDDLVEHFVHDNCACQKGRGTDYALKRMKIHLLRYFREHGREGWVLRCDIRHFFPSTRHDVAKAAVAKRIRDPKALQMVCTIIDSFGDGVGIGLGSQVSQLIELCVLDDLDHFIKERLHIRHYIRYMDDFILIHHDKAYLQWCLGEIRAQLEKLHFEMSPKKTVLHPLRQGIVFLQWRFLLTQTGGVRMKMSGSKMGRERRRLTKLLRKEKAGAVQPGTAQASLISWEANAKRGDTFYQVKRMKAFYNRKARDLNGNESGKTSQD